MAAWASNIQEAIRESVPDQGFNFDIDLFNLLTDEAGTLIGAGTTPVAVVSSDETFKRWAASNVDASYANVRLPRTLASRPSVVAATRDILFPRAKLHIVAVMSGASDTPRVTVTAKARNGVGALKATFTPTSLDSDGTTVLTNGTGKALSDSLQEIVWDFSLASGTGPVYLAPGDRFDIKIVPGTHGTDTVNLYDAWLEVWANANLTDITLRS